MKQVHLVLLLIGLSTLIMGDVIAAEGAKPSSQRIDLIFDPQTSQTPQWISGDKPPPYTRLFVDLLGRMKPQPAGMTIRSEWVWVPHSSGGLSPVLRNWVKFPEGAEPSDISPNTLRSETGEWAYDFTPDGAPITLKWTTLKDNKRFKFESGWIARLQYPFVWQHENCTNAGIKLGFLSDFETPLEESRGIIVVYCDPLNEKNETRITLQLFGEIQFGRVFPNTPPPQQQTWTIPPQSSTLPLGASLSQKGAFEVRNSSAGNESESVIRRIGVFYEPSTSWLKASHWRGSVALQASHLNYLETSYTGTQRATSRQWGATLKTGLDWSKKKTAPSDTTELPRWNIGVSAFGTFVSVFAEQAGPVVSPDYEGVAGAPRFLGVNLRAGRKLTAPASPWDLRASLGFYYWSMFQASRDFGLDYLAGPQVVLSLRRLEQDVRAYGGYIKLARTGMGFGLSLDEGRELAIGGEFQLNSPSSKNRITAVVDLANTTLNAQEVDRSMNLDSISFGIGMQF